MGIVTSKVVVPGDDGGTLTVFQTFDGDVRISVEDYPYHTVRFRLPIIGGGHHEGVYKALIALMKEIKQDPTCIEQE